MYNNIRTFIITGVNSLVIILYQNIKYSEYERNYRALLQEHFYFQATCLYTKPPMEIT